MENKLNGFVFYRSFQDSINDLDDMDALEMYRALSSYCFTSVEPEFSKKYLNAIFKSMKPNLDSSIHRYKVNVENGQKGGRPKSNTKSDVLTNEKFNIVQSTKQVEKTPDIKDNVVINEELNDIFETYINEPKPKKKVTDVIIPEKYIGNVTLDMGQGKKFKVTYELYRTWDVELGNEDKSEFSIMTPQSAINELISIHEEIINLNN